MRRLLLPAFLLVLTGCRGGGDRSSNNGILVTDHGRNPTVATDPRSGVTYVAWAASTDAGTDVFLSRVEDGAASGPVRVNPAPGEGGTHDQAPPQVAVAPDGTVLVAYVVQTPVEGRRWPASEIRLARSTDGGRSFEAPAAVSGSAGFPTSHHFHNLAVGPDGTVYVSWLDGAEQDRYNAAHPAAPMAMDHEHGTMMEHAVSGPGTEVRVARSADGGRSFEPPVVVARNTCQCCRTALAPGADGAVSVAWRQIYDEAGATIRDIAVARSTDGGATFSAPERVHADGWQIDGCPHAGPSLALDGDGRLVVSWFTGADGREGAYLAVADGGLPFGPPQPLATAAAGPHTALVAEADGSVEAAWEEGGRVQLGRIAPGAATPDRWAAWEGRLPALAASGAALAHGDSVLVVPFEAGRPPLATR